MSIVKYANEAKKMHDLWKELTYNEVGFEFWNKDLPRIEYIDKYVQSGSLKSGYNDIPTNEVCEVITGRDGFFGTLNQQGVMWLVPGKFYIAIIWRDPTVEVSTYCAYISGNPTALRNEMIYQASLSTLTGQVKGDINTGQVTSFNNGGVKVTIDPGFDPFKVTFENDLEAKDTVKLEGDNVYLVHEWTGNKQSLIDKYDRLSSILTKRSEDLKNTL
tara:strand:+ start:108 stop:758 length:651 start_codon:yes stop_codon:yes gene_type:complete